MVRQEKEQTGAVVVRQDRCKKNTKRTLKDMYDLSGCARRFPPHACPVRYVCPALPPLRVISRPAQKVLHIGMDTGIVDLVSKVLSVCFALYEDAADPAQGGACVVALAYALPTLHATGVAMCDAWLCLSGAAASERRLRL